MTAHQTQAAAQTVAWTSEVSESATPAGAMEISAAHVTPAIVMALQRTAGNQAVTAAIAERRLMASSVGRLQPRLLPPTVNTHRAAAQLLQRDPPFIAAPAPGVSRPNPPVPGTEAATAAKAAVRSEALKVGVACGTLVADIESSLSIVQKKWGGVSVWDRMTPDEKASWGRKAATRFEQLPDLNPVESAELLAAQEDAFKAGVESGYDSERLTLFMVNLGADVAVMLIMAAAAGGLLSGGMLSRLLRRGFGRAAVVIGGEGDTMVLYRYAKVAEDVQPNGWWTTRQATSRADAARLTGVPANECLVEQRITVNAAPSKYEQYFKMGPARSVGESLVDEFRNKALIPKSVIEVRPMGQ